MPPPKKFKNTKRQNVNVPNRLGDTVDKLHDIAQLATTQTEDQFDKFGLHIAAQLRELPLRSFIVLQDQIQALITRERLLIIESSYSSTPSPTTFHSQSQTEQIQQPESPMNYSNMDSNQQTLSTCFSSNADQEQADTVDIIQRAFMNIS